jgi:hypothetical protein
LEPLKVTDVHSITQVTVNGTVKTDIHPPSRRVVTKLTPTCSMRLCLARCSYERNHSQISQETVFYEKNLISPKKPTINLSICTFGGFLTHVRCGVSGGLIYATDAFWRMEDLCFVSSPCSGR